MRILIYIGVGIVLASSMITFILYEKLEDCKLAHYENSLKGEVHQKINDAQAEELEKIITEQVRQIKNAR